MRLQVACKARDLALFHLALDECTSCGNTRTLTGFDVVRLCGTRTSVVSSKARAVMGDG